MSDEAGTVTLTYDLGDVHAPVFLRVRGTDGNRSAPGLNGAAVDPAGPAMDAVGDADPWSDLWFCPLGPLSLRNSQLRRLQLVLRGFDRMGQDRLGPVASQCQIGRLGPLSTNVALPAFESAASE